jgi:hypothetical protein
MGASCPPPGHTFPLFCHPERAKDPYEHPELEGIPLASALPRRFSHIIGQLPTLTMGNSICQLVKDQQVTREDKEECSCALAVRGSRWTSRLRRASALLEFQSTLHVGLIDDGITPEHRLGFPALHLHDHSSADTCSGCCEDERAFGKRGAGRLREDGVHQASACGGTNVLRDHDPDGLKRGQWTASGQRIWTSKVVQIICPLRCPVHSQPHAKWPFSGMVLVGGIMLSFVHFGQWTPILPLLGTSYLR